MSVGGFLGWVHWGGKTNSKCGAPFHELESALNRKEKVNSAPAFISLCFYFKRFILFLIMHMYVWLCVSVCSHKPEAADLPGAGVTDNCELSDVGDGNWPQVLWKSSQCFEPLGHLSSSRLCFDCRCNTNSSSYQFVLEIKNMWCLSTTIKSPWILCLSYSSGCSQQW